MNSTSNSPSVWSRSRAKRCFDVIAVSLSFPLILPVLFAVGICVRLTSPGPVLFVQVRIGRGGAPFKIYKFRTMVAGSGVPRLSVTTAGNQSFTPIGPFLRKWKLDELPQLMNVICGDMSLVGPRPKVPEHQSGLLTCRPGVTGAATLAFGREEFLLAGIAKRALNDFVRTILLPRKEQIDSEYMSRASFVSDLKLIIKTLLRQWANVDFELTALGSSTNQSHALFAVTNSNAQSGSFQERAIFWRPSMKVIESTQDTVLKLFVVLAMIGCLAGC